MCPTTLLYAATALATSSGDIEVRWDVDPTVPYVGEAFELSLIVSFETTWADQSLAQLFPQELDTPLQLEGFDGVPESLEAVTTPAIERGVSLVLDGEVVRAERFDEGSRTTLRNARLFRARRAGTFDLPTPTVRYAFATEFRDDFVRGRVPVDLTELTTRGAEHAVEVRAIPEAERPVDFDGAVGEFSLEASLAPKSLEVGEITSFVVRVAGSAPLPPDVAPRLGAMDGFELISRSRRMEGSRTVFEFELRAVDETVTASPVARLVSFEPSGDALDASSFSRIESEALPVAVRSRRNPPAAPQDADPNEPASAAPRLPWTFGVLAFIAILAVVSSVRRIRYRTAARQRREEDAARSGTASDRGETPS